MVTGAAGGQIPGVSCERRGGGWVGSDEAARRREIKQSVGTCNFGGRRGRCRARAGKQCVESGHRGRLVDWGPTRGCALRLRCAPRMASICAIITLERPLLSDGTPALVRPLHHRLLSSPPSLHHRPRAHMHSCRGECSHANTPRPPIALPPCASIDLYVVVQHHATPFQLHRGHMINYFFGHLDTALNEYHERRGRDIEGIWGRRLRTAGKTNSYDGGGGGRGKLHRRKNALSLCRHSRVLRGHLGQ